MSTASIVAMFGESIAAPFAMPPTTNPSPSTTTSFVTVSVVRIALAASAACLGRRAAPVDERWQRRLDPLDGEPGPDRSRSSRRGRARGARQAPELRARRCARRRARPSAPVAALAHPLFSTTAAARPPFRRQVGTADLHRRGRQEVGGERRGGGDRSRVLGRDQRRGRAAPSGLMPLATPEATKPRGVRTVTAPSRAWATRRSPPGRGRRSQPGSPDRLPPSRGCRARPATPRTRFGRRSGR